MQAASVLCLSSERVSIPPASILCSILQVGELKIFTFLIKSYPFSLLLIPIKKVPIKKKKVTNPFIAKLFAQPLHLYSGGLTHYKLKAFNILVKISSL